MKYQIKLYYPETFIDYETQEEVDHCDIGWSWNNGPAIEHDNCIISITDTADNQSFLILPFSPLEKIKLIDIMIFLYHYTNHNYNNNDIFCFGDEKMSLEEYIKSTEVIFGKKRE